MGTSKVKVSMKIIIHWRKSDKVTARKVKEGNQSSLSTDRAAEYGSRISSNCVQMNALAYLLLTQFDLRKYARILP